MTKKRRFYLGMTIALLVVAFGGWKLMSRSAYESAAYSVIESDGRFEVRVYPDLMLATTATKFDLQGNDGSFMRLFRYISGANESDQKVAMTTPVFMEPEADDGAAQMGFVIPEKVTKQGVPEPSSSDVAIRKRVGGKFAVIRFSGRLNEKTRQQQEMRLRKWMEAKPLVGAAAAESAGYDAPFTPGFLRRNEVLIRLVPNS